jgi:hypothetical protein
MQLKIKRSQRDGMMGAVIFCIDARSQLTADEQRAVERHKLGRTILFTSEGARKARESSQAAGANMRGVSMGGGSLDDRLTSIVGSAGESLGHGLKAAAFGAIAAMKLKITVDSLQQGQHIELKNLDEVLGAEEAIMTACQNFKSYLDAAATFDGHEEVFDITADGAKAIERDVSGLLPEPRSEPAPSVTLQMAADSYPSYPTPSEPALVSNSSLSSADPSFMDRFSTPKGQRELLIILGIATFIMFILFNFKH